VLGEKKKAQPKNDQIHTKKDKNKKNIDGRDGCRKDADFLESWSGHPPPTASSIMSLQLVSRNRNGLETAPIAFGLVEIRGVDVVVVVAVVLAVAVAVVVAVVASDPPMLGLLVTAGAGSVVVFVGDPSADGPLSLSSGGGFGGVGKYPTLRKSTK
jgi:hypothetical protein